MKLNGWIGGALGLAILTAGLGGCTNVTKTDFDLAMQENQELRHRLTAEQAARNEAELRNASLEQENRDLASSADRLRTSGGTARGGQGTGFEAISGLSSYRTSGGEVVVEIAGDVLFDSGSAALKASSKRSLDQVAQVIRSRYPNNVIRVEGYTDTDPIRKSNWKTNERLSGERAMSVQEYLVTKSVPRKQIYFAGFGDTRPRTNKQQSRRVEIVILAQHQ
jgi:chemotaxis protein MotB